MSESKITKAKLLSNNEKLLVFHKRTNRDGSHSIIPGEEKDTIPHPDLIERFQDLAMHLALKCEYTHLKNSRNQETLSLFHVTGFTIFGKNDNGVILTGYRITEDGSQVTLNSPKIWFESENSTYYFLANLKKELGLLCDEIQAYLDGTKKGEAKVQPKKEESDDNDDQEEDPKPAKKRGRPKKAE